MRGALGILIMVTACGRSGFELVPDSRIAGDGTTDGSLGTTVTFGETPTADVQGVTLDTFITSEAINLANNFGGAVAIECEATEHALLRFDLTVLGPATQIVSAQLRLVTTAAPIGSMSMRAALEPWSEGAGIGTPGVANWNQRMAGTAWTTPGCDIPGSAGVVLAAVQTIATGANSIVIPPATIQGWIDNPNTNAGLVMTCSNDASFVSSEGAPATDRPLLTITRR